MSGRAGTNYEIVEYQPALKDQVLQLESMLWGADPAANASYFEWKYERNPQADGPMQLGLFAAAPSATEEAIRKLDLDALSPIEALLKLQELKKKLG